MKDNLQKGVALVTTLIMLSIITLMTVAFLAMSRRERASVTVVKDIATAQQMAEMAIERAKAETASRILSHTNLYAYDFIVSTNWLNPRGFVSGNANSANVNYTNNSGALLRNEGDLLRNLANLQFDPRPPVFYDTNLANTNRPSQTRDFRFWLDLNRNGEFEQSGLLPVAYWNGATTVTNPGDVDVFTGDPEWVGVLEKPGEPHSSSNHFVGRWAFLALPSGKSLDLNFIHNQAKRLPAGGGDVDAFNRDQGVGSWEINLAAFLRELNTNIWDQNAYQQFLPVEYPDTSGNPINMRSSLGYAFDDAKDLLIYRYDVDPENGTPAGSRTWGWQNLEGIYEAFNNRFPIAQPVLRENLVDDFSDGLFISQRLGEYGDEDEPAPRDFGPFPTGRPWSGSASTNAYKDPQELFKVNPWYNNPTPGPNELQRLFTSRLTRESGVVPAAVSQSQSSYDRYTFYRMLSQMGVDSVPANQGKINLNYDNRADLGMVTNRNGTVEPLGARSTDFQEWDAGVFFNLAADRILREQFPGTGISITNIPVYPTNLVDTATLFRSLQLAANIYEASFHGETNINRYGTSFEFPRVFKPLYAGYNTNYGGTNTEYIYIKGFRRITDRSGLDYVWRDLNIPNDRVALEDPANSENMVFGIPLVIGARKGLPNFNEFALQTIITATRKLKLERDIRDNISTNQQYIFSISNRVQAELWNPYAPTTNSPGFEREVRVLATNYVTWAIRDRNGNNVWTGDKLTHQHDRFNNPTDNPSLVSWPGWTFTPGVSELGSSALYPFRETDRVADSTNVNFVMLPRRKYTDRPDAPSATFDNTDPRNPTWDPPNVFEIPQLDLVFTNRLTCLMYDFNTGAIIDFVNIANVVRKIDFTEELLGNRNQAGDVSTAARLWRNERPGATQTDVNAPTRGIIEQIQVSLGNTPAPYWIDEYDTSQTPSKAEQIERFREWMGYGIENTPAQTTSPSIQAPFTPGIKLRDVVRLQADDPLVHYTREDLTDNRRQQNPDIERYPDPTVFEGENGQQLLETTHSIGRLNQQYKPWGGPPVQSDAGDNFARVPTVKDAGIISPDSWQFRTNKYENVGALGAVHRGTPWQTVYLKSNGGGGFSPLLLRGWINYSGQQPLAFHLPMTNSLGDAITNSVTGETNYIDQVFTSHPTNDWMLTDLFTTAYNDNAARGLLGVNQTNVAAWAGVLGGVKVLRDAQVQDNTGARLLASEILIDPATDAFRQLINGTNSINALRADTNFFSGHFPTGGAVLAAPKLTLDSPYINWSLLDSKQSNNLISDEVMEKIPRQIMSLIKRDDPLITIYAYGETLQPASANAVYRGLGQYSGMVTNYVVTARYVVKEMVELTGDPEDPNGDLRLKTLSHDVIYEE